VLHATSGFSRTVMPKLTLAPGAKVCAVHVTVPLVLTAGFVQVKPEPGGMEFEMKTVPAGNASVNVALSAGSAAVLARVKL